MAGSSGGAGTGPRAASRSSPIAITSRAPARCAAAASAGSVTTRAAPESASWAASSRSEAAALTPVTATPARIAPSVTPAHGGRFGAHSASTSPGPSPRSASSAATRSARPASSA